MVGQGQAPLAQLDPVVCGCGGSKIGTQNRTLENGNMVSKTCGFLVCSQNGLCHWCHQTRVKQFSLKGPEATSGHQRLWGGFRSPIKGLWHNVRVPLLAGRSHVQFLPALIFIGVWCSQWGLDSASLQLKTSGQAELHRLEHSTQDLARQQISENQVPLNCRRVMHVISSGLSPSILFQPRHGRAWRS